MRALLSSSLPSRQRQLRIAALERTQRGRRGCGATNTTTPPAEPSPAISFLPSETEKPLIQQPTFTEVLTPLPLSSEATEARAAEHEGTDPPAMAAQSAGERLVQSVSEYDGMEGETTDTGGWATSRALQLVFPPRPTIVGWSVGGLLIPSWYSTVCARAFVLPAAQGECTASDAAPARDAWCGPADTTAAAAAVPTDVGGRREADSVLAWVATLPCRAGVRIAATASPGGAADARTMPFGVRQERLRVDTGMKPSTSMDEEMSDKTSGSFFHPYEKHQKTEGVDTSGGGLAGAAQTPTQSSRAEDAGHGWANIIANREFQLCSIASGTMTSATAETTAAALHGPSATGPCTYAPILSFVAERPCTTADDGDAEMKACDANAQSIPVERYAERTPLMCASGTAALQRNMQRALKEAAWLRTSPAGKVAEEKSEGIGSEVRGSQVPRAHPHVVWTGREWELEGDAQLMEAQEQLLGKMYSVGDGDDNLDDPANRSKGVNPTALQLHAARGPSRVRAWLLSEWTTHNKRVHVPLTEVSCSSSSGYYSFPSTSSRPWHAAVPVGGGTATPFAACNSWVFRLRKTWWVRRTGHCAPHAAPPSPPGSPPAQLNYDLMSGTPLNLFGYMTKLVQRRRYGDAFLCTQIPPSQQQQMAAKKMKKDAPWGTRTAQAADTPLHQDNCVFHAHPMTSAIRSGRCGWVRVTRGGPAHEQTALSGSSSSSGGGNAAAPQPLPWRLPNALRAFRLPVSAAEVRAPCLADDVAATPPPQAGEAPSLTCYGAVALPHKEWFTGFFVHSAPHWWLAGVEAVRSVDPNSSMNSRATAAATAEATPAALPSAVHGTVVSDAECSSSSSSVHDCPAHNGYAVLRRLMALGHIPELPQHVQWRIPTAAHAAQHSEASDAATATTRTPSTNDGRGGEGVSTVREAEPVVYLLRLCPATPSVQPTPHLTSADSVSVTDASPAAAPVALQWTVCDKGDSAGRTITTVNFALSLHDALRLHRTSLNQNDTKAADDTDGPDGVAMASQSAGVPYRLYDDSLSRWVVGFVEAKAALEVLRRVHVSAGRSETEVHHTLQSQRCDGRSGGCGIDKDSVMHSHSSSLSSRWWGLLDSFHRHNTVAVGASRKKGHTQRPPQSLPGTGKDEQGGTAASSSAAIISALCHPTAAETARVFLSLVTQQQQPFFSANNLAAGTSTHPPLRTGLLAAGEKEPTASTAAAAEAMVNPWVAVWTRSAYHALWSCALQKATALPQSHLSSLTASQLDSLADSAEVQLDEEGMIEDADKNGTLSRGSSSSREKKRRDVESMEEDDEAQPPQPHEQEEQEEEEDEEEEAAQACLSEDIDRTSRVQLPHGVEVFVYDDDGTRLHRGDSHQSRSATSNDNEENKRTAAQGDAAGSEDVFWSLCQSSAQRPRRARKHPSQSIGSSPSCAHATDDTDEKTKGPYCYLPFSPPIPVAALGVKTAHAIAEAHELHKLHGYIPARPAPGYGQHAPFNPHTNSGDGVTGHQAGDPAQLPHVSAELSTLETATTGGEKEEQQAWGAVSAPPRDLIDQIIQREERLFHESWRPWLKLLPAESSVPPVRLATDPRRAFPFLRPSRTAACHLQAGLQRSDGVVLDHSSHKRGELRADDNGDDDHGSPTSRGDASSETMVSAFDLGLCVLQIEYDELYINAANLLDNTSNVEY